MSTRSFNPSCEIHVPGVNRLLTMLRDAGEQAVLDRMEKVSLSQNYVLSKSGQRIEHVYFPLSGVASFVLVMQEGVSVEVGTVGNEGHTAASLALGAGNSPIEAFVQIRGDFMSMTAEAFKVALHENGTFARIARLAAQGFYAQVTQSVGCGRAHPVEQRLARWILASHDRVGGNVIRLTQEFLGLMLGVNRSSVTIAARTLQEAGLIYYRRGVITVINRPALEESACECYERVRKEYARLLC